MKLTETHKLRLKRAFDWTCRIIAAIAIVATIRDTIREELANCQDRRTEKLLLRSIDPVREANNYYYRIENPSSQGRRIIQARFVLDRIENATNAQLTAYCESAIEPGMVDFCADDFDAESGEYRKNLHNLRFEPYEFATLRVKIIDAQHSGKKLSGHLVLHYRTGRIESLELERVYVSVASADTIKTPPQKVAPGTKAKSAPINITDAPGVSVQRAVAMNPATPLPQKAFVVANL